MWLPIWIIFFTVSLKWALFLWANIANHSLTSFYNPNEMKSDFPDMLPLIAVFALACLPPPCSYPLRPAQWWACQCICPISMGTQPWLTTGCPPPFQPAREWEYMLSSPQDCLGGDSPRHNPHRGHITGPLVQLFHLQCVPVADLSSIQHISFCPCNFPFRNNPRWL